MGPCRVTVDNSPPGAEAGVLTGFIMGRRARAWGPAREREGAVVERFVRLFGEEVLHWDETDWSADPWARGGYGGFFPPGALTNHGPALREPVGRRHWAGTETAACNGYMEGAVEAGERAEREAIPAVESVVGARNTGTTGGY